MKRARAQIDLGTLGISDIRPKRAVSGGLLLEIPGQGRDLAADRLLDRLEETFRGEDRVRFSRPCKSLELRLSGFDDSITQAEVRTAVVLEGLCSSELVQIGRVSFSRRGMGSIWVKCPVDVGRALAKAGRIKLGWTMARIEVLESPLLRCFRCLARGHVQQTCPSATDRSLCCFNCGEPDNRRERCEKRPRCPLCVVRGLPHSHRPGSMECRVIPPAPTSSNRRVNRAGSGPSGVLEESDGDRDTVRMSQVPLSSESSPEGPVTKRSKSGTKSVRDSPALQLRVILEDVVGAQSVPLPKRVPRQRPPLLEVPSRDEGVPAEAPSLSMEVDSVGCPSEKRGPRVVPTKGDNGGPRDEVGG
ncbi:hypothetical protein ALC62_02059 [Cyphomyrmex costatus]|uniref:CCHC-type domain-containing protein n=1 Tax=Cyphomyrmex costatus TaxID=456900 RepID=A0A151INE2_9HYME|nr:hypothetical protein ALC62_02059 [Cyphomyrmex costatus]